MWGLPVVHHATRCRAENKSVMLSSERGSLEVVIFAMIPVIYSKSMFLWATIYWVSGFILRIQSNCINDRFHGTY